MLKNLRLRNQIEILLKKYPHCRDDDQKLMCNVWHLEAKEILGDSRYMNTGFFEGMKLIATGKLSKPESIRRTRQKLQEMYPELRGKNYRERHRNQSKVKQELRQFS